MDYLAENVDEEVEEGVLGHEHVRLRALVVLVVRWLVCFSTFRDGCWVLYADYLVVDQADAVVDVVVLILRIRHVVSLHVEDENVVTEKAALTVEDVVHLGLILQPL